MLFSEVIGEITGAWGPIDVELALLDLIADPIKSHIHRFGSDLLDGVVDDSKSSGVIGLDGRGRLWMPHFDAGSAEWNGFLGVEE